MTRRVEKKGGHLFIARLIVQNFTLLRDNGARSCRRSADLCRDGVLYTWTSLWAIDDAEVDRSARAHHGFRNLRPKHSTNVVDVVVVVHHERGEVGHHEEHKKSVGNNELHRNRHSNRHRNVPRKGEMRDCGR